MASVQKTDNRMTKTQMTDTKMTSKQALGLFVILWLHITLLNFAYIGYNGIVFLWQENLDGLTLITHIVAAATAVLCFCCVEQLINKIKALML